MQGMHGKQKNAENADIKDLDPSQKREKLSICNKFFISLL
jgi:hypothetical protein